MGKSITRTDKILMLNLHQCKVVEDTKFVRFNVIQAILLNIICSCVGVIFTFLPVVLKESMLGSIFANFLYLGIILLIAYSSLLIAYGRYPSIPVLSDAARLQVQQRD